MNINTKKIIAVTIVVFLIILIGIFVESLNNKQDSVSPYNIKDKKETDTQNNKTPVTSTTGGLITKHTDEENQAAMQFSNLRQKLPLNTQEFSISKFDFNTFKVDITFSNPQNTNNKQIFEQWLIDNNYDKIEKKYFNFIN